MAEAVDPDWTWESGRRRDGETACHAQEAKLAPVRAHPFRVRQNVAFHGVFQFLSAGPCLQVERSVESVQLEEVAMHFAGRRAWAAITDAIEIVPALTGAILKHFSRRHSLWQSRKIGGHVPDQPVCPRTSGCIRIIHNQRQRVGRG